MRKKAVPVGLKIGIASHGKEVKAKWGLSKGVEPGPVSYLFLYFPSFLTCFFKKMLYNYINKECF